MPLGEATEHLREEEAVRPSISSVPAASALVPHLAALALLVAFLSIFFWQLTIQHRVLSPADLIFTAEPWRNQPPEGFRQASNPYQSDDAFLYFQRRWSLFRGDGMSWWQDDYLSGSRNTFSNDFLGLTFYPPAWVHHALPFHVANSLFLVSTLLVAGLSMYLLLWQLRLPWLAAVYGALLFMLNGHFVAWLTAPTLPAMLALIPLMIFGFERYQEQRQPLYLLIPALSLAMQIFLAYIPGLVVAGSVLSIYGLVRVVPLAARRQPGAMLRQLAVYSGTLFVGALLSAYALIPSLASALQSSYQRERALGLAHLPLENAWTYLFPKYWGTVHYWFGAGGNFLEWVGYAGVSAAPLALLGLWQLRRRWLAWFALGVLMFSASQVYGIPPLKEVAELPGIKQVAVGRWLFGLNLAAALLAPLGLAVLLDKQLPANTRRLLAAALAGSLLVALAAVGLLYVLHRDSAAWSFITEGSGIVPAPRELIGEIAGFFTHFHRQLALLLLGGGGAILALLLRQRWARLAAIAIVLLAFADLFSFGFRYEGTVAKQNLYPETPGMTFLRQDAGLFRIAPVASDGGSLILPGYTPALYGLSTVAGYDHYRDQDYASFLAPLFSQTDRDIFQHYGYVTVGTNRQALNTNILSLLNVKYVVTPPGGLFYSVLGQGKNETALKIYRNVRQGQMFRTDNARIDAFEFLLATGGGPGPDSEVIIQLKNQPDDPDVLHSWTVNGRSITNNKWFRVDVPPQVDTSAINELYVEIQAPEVRANKPLYIWGVREEPLPDAQRFRSGVPAAGTLAFRALRGPEPWFVPVYQGPDLAVYELSRWLPQAWGVGAAEVVATRADAIGRVAQADFDPSTSVVLARDSFSGTASANEGEFPAEITRYRPDSMVVQTRFTAPGYLVISRRFDGGWRAEVDGSSVRLLRANGILQAVPVPAGKHTVTLSFEPQEYVWGKRISMVTAGLLGLAVLAYLARPLVKRRRSAAASGP